MNFKKLLAAFIVLLTMASMANARSLFGALGSPFQESNASQPNTHDISRKALFLQIDIPSYVPSEYSLRNGQSSLKSLPSGDNLEELQKEFFALREELDTMSRIGVPLADWEAADSELNKAEEELLKHLDLRMEILDLLDPGDLLLDERLFLLENPPGFMGFFRSWGMKESLILMLGMLLMLLLNKMFGSERTMDVKVSPTIAKVVVNSPLEKEEIETDS